MNEPLRPFFFHYSTSPKLNKSRDVQQRNIRAFVPGVVAAAGSLLVL